MRIAAPSFEHISPRKVYANDSTCAHAIKMWDAELTAHVTRTLMNARRETGCAGDTMREEKLHGRHNGVVLDVGAHAGWFALIGASLGFVAVCADLCDFVKHFFVLRVVLHIYHLPVNNRSHLSHRSACQPSLQPQPH